MSTSVGTVSFIQGQAIAIATDGSERVLALGDQVMSDEVVRTSPDARIEISMEGGELVTLTNGDSWVADAAAVSTGEGAVGTVSMVSGQVVALAADGSERVLMAGDIILADEVIRTGPDARIEIAMQTGEPVTLQGGQSWLVSLDTYTPVDQFDVDSATADITALQQAILAGQDPTEILDPTAAGAPAAGAPAAGNEGADFVQLQRTGAETTPEAGYDTIGLSSTVLTPEGEDPVLPVDEPGDPLTPPEEPEEPEIPENGLPTAGEAQAFLDEDDILGLDGGEQSELAFAPGFFDVIESFYQSTGYFSGPRGNQGNDDVAAGDDLPVGSSPVFSGTLPLDYGPDGAGDTVFDISNLPTQGLTSRGEIVQYWLSEDGHSLVAYVLPTGEGFQPQLEIDLPREQLPGEDYPVLAMAEVIFVAQLDPETGAYSVTLTGSLDHDEAGTEDNLLINIGYQVSDADGDVAQGTLTLNIDDDSPVIDQDAEQAESLRVDETVEAGGDEENAPT